LALGTPAQAAAGVKVGTLTCNESSGWGFVFGSSRSLKCSYSSRAGVTERYVGRISKFGVDIGYLSNAVIVWVVVAPSPDVAPGALAGAYGGATGGASIGLGLGANVLIGGSAKSIALQPVSFEGNRGLNVAAGIASMTLESQH
jgi:di/tricarboxylate transporter